MYKLERKENAGHWCQVMLSPFKTREDIIKIQKDTMLCLAMHLPIHKQ